MGVRKPALPMNSQMVERGTSPLPSPHFAPPTPQNAEREKGSQRLGEIVRRVIQGFNSRMVRGNLTLDCRPVTTVYLRTKLSRCAHSGFKSG